MVAATDPGLVESVSSVVDVRAAIEDELDETDHQPERRDDEGGLGDSSEVREQLEDLGYM
jgi:hypothetical protein